MISHADTIHAMTDLHRHDLLSTAARERRAATAVGSASPWRPLALRALAHMARAHGRWRAEHAAREYAAAGERGRPSSQGAARHAEKAQATAY